MIATIGGFPAARRERTTGRKSRAVSYFVLIPVSAVNCVRTFWKASCSLPPHSDNTLTVPVPSSLPPSPPPHAAAEIARATARTSAARCSAYLLITCPPPSVGRICPVQYPDRRNACRLSPRRPLSAHRCAHATAS